MRQLLPAGLYRGALRVLGLTLCCAPLCSAQDVATPVPAPTEQDTPAEIRTLTRVAPVLVETEANADTRAGLFARDFDREQWMARLRATDLVQRELDFDDLLRRARLDPFARVFLERLADGDDVELAWTAKLGLRELGKPTLPLLGTGRAQEDFEQLYREMIGSSPDLLFMTKSDPRVRVVQIDGDDAEADGPTRIAAVRSVQLQQGEDGAKIIVTDTVKGQESTRTYEGASIEAILAENENLRRDLSLSAEGLPEAFSMRMSVPPGAARRQSLLDPFEYGARRDEERDRSEWIDGGDGATGFFSPAAKKVAVRTDVFGVVSAPVEPDEAKARGVAGGVLVLRVERGTIADMMDIRSGDILLKLCGAALVRPEDITELMRARERHAAISVLWQNDLEQLMTSTWTPDRSVAPPAVDDGAHED